jgi:outer membrane protein
MLTTAIAGLLTAAAANAQVPPQAPAQAPAQASAQAPAPEPSESLIDIYKRALENDPAFREAEAQYLATAQVKPMARSYLLPALNLSATRGNQNIDTKGGAVATTGQAAGTRSIRDFDNHSYSVALTQTLFDWGQLKTLKQADKRVAQAETTYEAAKQDLTTRVATRYFAVLGAEDSLASARSARESISRQLEQAQRRFEVGLIAITDVQQSQAGYDNAVAEEILSQQQLATAHEFLREIIGEDVAKLAGPKEDFPLLSPDPMSPEAWVNRALADNLTLNAQRLALDVANDQIEIDRGSRLPKLSLSGTYQDGAQDLTQTIYYSAPNPLCATAPFTPCSTLSPTQPTNKSWSIDLRFPLYTGGYNSAKIQQSVYNSRLTQQTLERVTRQTERQTRDSYLTVLSDISRVRALKQSVESNRTALRATEAGFEVGTQTTVDVLAAQNSLRIAETSYSQARYNYLLAVVALKQAAGSLSEADVMQIDGWLQ